MSIKLPVVFLYYPFLAVEYVFLSFSSPVFISDIDEISFVYSSSLFLLEDYQFYWFVLRTRFLVSLILSIVFLYSVSFISDPNFYLFFLPASFGFILFWWTNDKTLKY